VDTHEAIERIRAFQAGVDEGAAEEVRDWPYGRALLSPAIPRVWDANYCRIDDARGASAAEIAAAATEVAEASGWAHVALVARKAEAARLAPGLAELGFEATEHVTLGLSGRPPDPAIEVGRATFDEVAPHRATLALEFAPENHELARQLNVLDKRLEASIGGEWFAIREADEIVSRCWLLGADGVAQVEDVATSIAARGRGLAGAVVSAATLAALDAGSEVVFIVADCDGDAQRLYRRLGYEPLARSTRFVLNRA
jgi:ribosomal protein S18 acetylase RimI-like enzyme